MAWRPFKQQTLREGWWCKGWHSCRLEGLYTVLFHGEIFASTNPEQGHRVLQDRRGVYLHSDCNHAKSGNYHFWLPMTGDGIYWTFKLEVLYDVTQSVKHGAKTDQIIQSSGSVHIAAVWVAAKSAGAMCPAEVIQSKWWSLQEANPRHSRSQRTLGTMASTGTRAKTTPLSAGTTSRSIARMVRQSDLFVVLQSRPTPMISLGI